MIPRNVIPLVPQSKLKLTFWYWWWFSSSKPCQIWCKICSIGPKSGETHDFWPRRVPNVYVTTTDDFWYIMNDFWSTEFDVYARRPLRCRLWCSLTVEFLRKWCFTEIASEDLPWLPLNSRDLWTSIRVDIGYVKDQMYRFCWAFLAFWTPGCGLTLTDPFLLNLWMIWVIVCCERLHWIMPETACRWLSESPGIYSDVYCSFLTIRAGKFMTLAKL